MSKRPSNFLIKVAAGIMILLGCYILGTWAISVSSNSRPDVENLPNDQPTANTL